MSDESMGRIVSLKGPEELRKIAEELKFTKDLLRWAAGKCSENYCLWGRSVTIVPTIEKNKYCDYNQPLSPEALIPLLSRTPL